MLIKMLAPLTFALVCDFSIYAYCQTHCKMSPSSLKCRYHLGHNIGRAQVSRSVHGALAVDGSHNSSHVYCPHGYRRQRRRQRTRVNHCYEFWQSWSRIRSATIRSKQVAVTWAPWCALIWWLRTQTLRNFFRMVAFGEAWYTYFLIVKCMLWADRAGKELLIMIRFITLLSAAVLCVIFSVTTDYWGREHFLQPFRKTIELL